MDDTSIGRKEVIKMFTDIDGVSKVDINDIVRIHVFVPNPNAAVLRTVFNKELELRRKYPCVLIDFEVEWRKQEK